MDRGIEWAAAHDARQKGWVEDPLQRKARERCRETQAEFQGMSGRWQKRRQAIGQQEREVTHCLIAVRMWDRLVGPGPLIAEVHRPPAFGGAPGDLNRDAGASLRNLGDCRRAELQWPRQQSRNERDRSAEHPGGVAIRHRLRHGFLSSRALAPVRLGPGTGASRHAIDSTGDRQLARLRSA